VDTIEGIINELLNYRCTRLEAERRLHAIKSEMPDLTAFKARRNAVNIKLIDLSDASGVSIATISRLENGNEVEYNNVKKVHDVLIANGA